MLSISDVETGGREARLDLLFSPTSFNEPYKLYYKEDVSTAHWRPPGEGRVHIICVGGSEFSGTQPVGYARSLVWHELGHALWTERDLIAVQGKLELEGGIPFGLLNFFEDARIEERFRRETELRFEWTAYELLQAAGPEPQTMLFRLIQLEGDESAYFEGVPEDIRGLGEEVLAFWHRMVECEDTWALIPLLKEWLARWPDEKCTYSDGLSTSVMLAGLPEAAAIEGATELGEGGSSAAGSPLQSGGGRKGGEAANVISGNLDNFLAREEGWSAPLDAAGIARLVAALRRGLPSCEGAVYTDVPGRRLKAQRVATGRAPYRATSAGRRGRIGRRKVSLVLDCSGSMFRAIVGGRMLAAALSRLAQEGLVEGHLVLSKGRDEDQGLIHAAVKWPVPDRVLEEIAADGYIEGLENAISSNRDKLLGHTVLVYSDGSIGDDPIRPESLQGINVMGVYCSESAAREGEEGLRQYFNTVIARGTIEDIACGLAQELRRL